MVADRLNDEACLTPQQVGKRIGQSSDFVRRTFRPLKGVLVIGEGERKRIRIPESVLAAWIEARKVGGGKG